MSRLSFYRVDAGYADYGFFLLSFYFFKTLIAFAILFFIDSSNLSKSIKSSTVLKTTNKQR